MVADNDPAINEELRRADALVFVDDLDAPAIADEDIHHLVDVLRLRSGAKVAFGNGRGAWRLTEISRLPAPNRRRARSTGEADTVTFVPIGDLHQGVASTPELSVAFAIPKGDRLDLIVQKLTELGIDHVIPVITHRTVVRIDDTGAVRRHERMLRIAREAASQSRRLFMPTVHMPRSLEAFLADRGNDVVVAEPGGASLKTATSCVLVGPEGGWDDREIPTTIARVGLGPSILRAETAAITAGALLMALRSGVIADE